MNHLEQLIFEWLELKGYFVRHNINVGKLGHGGHEMELDILAYHPKDNHLLQIEPSLDAHTWEIRERRYKKKFSAGEKYIKLFFPWIDKRTKFEQWAVLAASDQNHKTIGGGTVVPISRLIEEISKYVRTYGPPSRHAIPEQYPLLRTIQSVKYFDRNGAGK